jgi:hypothetical protein
MTNMKKHDHTWIKHNIWKFVHFTLTKIVTCDILWTIQSNAHTPLCFWSKILGNQPIDITRKISGQEKLEILNIMLHLMNCLMNMCIGRVFHVSCFYIPYMMWDYFLIFWHYYIILFEFTCKFCICNKINVIISKVHYESFFSDNSSISYNMILIKVYYNMDILNLTMIMLNKSLHFKVHL